MPDHASASAHQVAAALIAEQHRRGNRVDTIQLQSLLYLVQGVHFVLWSRPAFSDAFFASEWGPAIASVDKAYREQAASQSNIPAPVNAEAVSAEVGETVGVVLDHFGTWSATDLQALTKDPTSPWREARSNVASTPDSEPVIPFERIARWFASRPLVSGAEPDERVREAFARTTAEGSAPSRGVA